MRPLVLASCLLCAASAAADEPPAAPVPVTFVNGHAGPPYRVLVDHQFCATPCVLWMPPGEHRLLVASHATQFEQPLDVPARPVRATIASASVGRLLLGILGTAYGSGMAAGGAVMLANDFPHHDLLGGVFLGVGALLAVIGTVALSTLRGPRVEVTPDF